LTPWGRVCQADLARGKAGRLAQKGWLWPAPLFIWIRAGRCGGPATPRRRFGLASPPVALLGPGRR